MPHLARHGKVCVIYFGALVHEVLHNKKTKMARKRKAEEPIGDRVTTRHSHDATDSMLQRKGGILEKIVELDCQLSAAFSISGRPKTVGVKLITIALKFLEITGHGIPWIAGTVMFACKSKGYMRTFSINMLIALLLDLLIVGVIKVVSKRQRPVYNKDDMFATVSVDKYSFPSGHATRAVLLAILFAYIDLPWQYAISIGTWAFTIAVSRVILGRHHVLDVVAGVLIGISEALLMLLFIWMDEDSLKTTISEIDHWLLKHNFPTFPV